jgi:hypothetical protein
MGLTVSETKELVGWMEAAFERYAARQAHVVAVCEPGETPEQSHNRILRYRGQFSRVLRGTADYHVIPPKVLDDLYDLKKCGCPPQDIVELMLACTNWLGGDLSKVDEAFGIPEALNAVRRNCRKMSDDISTLNLSVIFIRPHDFLRAQFPNKRERRRARRLIDGLPDALLYMEKLLEKYVSALAPVPKSLLKSITEKYFSALLAVFGHDDKTLSGLLEAMRAIRFAVSPDATYVRKIAATPVRSGKRKGEEKDPLSVGAIQKRLDRLVEQYPSLQTEVMSDVRQYVADEYADHRRSGATLISLLPQLEKDRQRKWRLAEKSEKPKPESKATSKPSSRKPPNANT